jgi:hypothetical protein
VKAHVLRNQRLRGWRETMVGRWTYKDLIADPEWFHGWISFDAVAFHPGERKIYCGLNSLDGDLLYSFDPESETFECLETKQWTDAFDVKIHRTILHNPGDGCLYFATSLLHDLEDQQRAKGGKLVRYDPASHRYELLDVPAARLYIQSIAADWTRRLIYSFTCPAEAVYRTELGTRRSTLAAYIGNATLFCQPHNAVVDRHGWLWGTCGEMRAWDEAFGLQPVRLFKYHPDNDCLVIMDRGLPRWEEHRQLLPDPAGPRDLPGVLTETRHKQDFGFCDSMVYDGERYIYAGTVAGVLCRIDTETGAVEKVANAIATGRFPALALREGVLYGAGGMHGHTRLVRWDTRGGELETYDDLVDAASGERPARVHELALDDKGRVYLGENDNHDRSSYLWSVTLE